MNFKLTSVAAALLAATAPAAVTAAPKAKPASSSIAAEATPTPKFAAAPAWVRKEPIPKLEGGQADAPFRFLLSNSQERLTTRGVENVVEYVVQPLNQAGVQAIGTVIIPWNVNRTDLTLNAVTVTRGSETRDVLRREDVSVIRREAKLDQSTLTGIRSVVLPVHDLRVGDILRAQFTYTANDRKLGAPEEVQDFESPFPIDRVVRRIIVADDVPVRWAIDPSVKQSAPGRVPEGVDRVFVAENVVPGKERQYVPKRFQRKLLQVSAYQDWQQVADTIAPLFNLARKTDENSAVAKLADKIAAEHSKPEGRMLAALRSVQEDVRYVAILLGDGDYTPMSADQAWSGRFADCKGKTALLLALLDGLNISADPVLASVEYDDGLDQRLPTLALLDHVYVRARVGADTYYLDGTQFGQRTLEELKQSPTRHALPLIEKTMLTTAPDVLPSQPLQQTQLVWDARNGVLGEVPFEATLTLRGSAAAEMRMTAQASTDRDKLIEKLKSKVSRVPNDALEHVSTDAEAADGSYVVRFKGKSEIDWRPVDGMKGNRMELDQTTITWDGEFDRDEGAGKEAPILMAFPYWERTTEKVILPAKGKDFWVDSKPINETVAATRLSRSVSMTDGVVTAVSDFVRLNRELAAEEGRRAKEKLEAIAENAAYLVSKRKLKLPD